MTLDTLGYLAWTAKGQSFCVHPAVYIHETAASIACHLCSTILVRK